MLVLMPWPKLLKAWLALSSVNNHRNVYVVLDTSQLMFSSNHALSDRPQNDKKIVITLAFLLWLFLSILYSTLLRNIIFTGPNGLFSTNSRRKN